MRGLWVCGVGGVGPGGAGLEAPADPGPGPRRVPQGLPLKEGFPPGAVRWLDALSLWWAHAARQALGAAESGPVGQVVGLGWGPIQPLEDLIGKAHAEGFSAMNPALFPYSVGNAAAGQGGILLGLKGPALTLYAKEASGLAAVVEACRLLGAGMAPACVAGGVDALNPFLLQVLRGLRGRRAAPPGEGAYALLLRAGDGPRAGDLARVAGWASRSVPCDTARFPEPAPLVDALSGALARAAGWGLERADWLALPADTEGLRAYGEVLAAGAPGARLSDFQARLGACGASWAGAAALASKALAAGTAGKAALLAVASGGTAVGLALEALHAE